jgi:hypothetical protein
VSDVWLLSLYSFFPSHASAVSDTEATWTIMGIMHRSTCALISPTSGPLRKIREDSYRPTAGNNVITVLPSLLLKLRHKAKVTVPSEARINKHMQTATKTRIPDFVCTCWCSNILQSESCLHAVQRAAAAKNMRAREAEAGRLPIVRRRINWWGYVKWCSGMIMNQEAVVV